MDTIGRYRIRGELGRGVFRAHDPELERDVAIKAVPLEGATPAQIAALASEIQAAAELHHPNTVAVFEFLHIGDQAFIVTELAGGTSLEAMIAAGGARDTAQALRILREAATALDAAHAAGIVHRGVEPGNILLDESGRVKLTGFGVARATPESTNYSSPEQLRGDPLDGRSDQFSLAIVACQLLTGELPSPARSGNPDLPAAVDAALNIALQTDPARRFPTCAAFIDALAGAARARPRIPAKAIIAVVMVSSVLILFMGYRAMAWLENPVSHPAPEPVADTAPVATGPAAPDSLALILDGTPMDFAVIPAGHFVMGCNSCKDGARPEHMVELTHPFQIGRTEVTEKHWNAVMTGKSTGANKPKVQVSWNDTRQFLAKLNALNDGFAYRLPTEAEWEYAARANDPGERPRNLNDLAWTSSNSGGQLQEPASAKLGNGWGLYDMLGNVSEWTHDWLAVDYYQSSPPRDPKGPLSGTMRVFRGGNGGTGATLAGYAHRAADKPGAKGPWLGFRVVRERK